MKISIIKNLSFFILLSLPCIFYGQHTEIIHDSGASSATLQLTEEQDNDFARLFFVNSKVPADKWSLAGRLGSTASLRDFGLFYNGQTRWIYNESDRLFKLETVRQTIDYNSSAGVPQLYINELGGGPSFGRITFGSQVTGLWTIAARHGAGAGEDDFNIYYNDEVNPGYNIINIAGDEKLINMEASVDIFNDLDVGGLATVDDLSVSERAAFGQGLLSSESIQLRESGQGPSGGTLEFMNDNSSTTVGASIKLTNGTGGGNNRNLIIENTNGAGNISFISDGAGVIMRMNNNAVSPGSTASKDLGSAGARWRDIYLSNNPDVSSDIRLKNSINDISENTLDKVLMLKPKTYRYNHQETNENKTVGFIAQDVEKLFPELVRAPETAEEYYSMNYDGIGVVAIKAIQEQHELISEQQSQISTLSSELKSVQKELEIIKALLKADK